MSRADAILRPAFLTREPISRMPSPANATLPDRSSAWAVFIVFLRLGLTSFGGPVAHLGYFHAEFVHRRRWMDDRRYADLVALCQFLPGPASSQVGIAIGLLRAGYPGALAAWAGFTLPSAAVLTLFAFGLASAASGIPPGLVHGLKIVAVAVVAQAVWGMAKNICTDARRKTLSLLAACTLLTLPGAWAQLAVIAMAGLIGLAWFRIDSEPGAIPAAQPNRQAGAAVFIVLFFALLAALPVLAAASQDTWVALLDTFYRAGALVFGGGHVVLPLLQAEVVPNGWVSNDAFLAGYGAAQAVPGPLFTFSAFLGGLIGGTAHGLASAALCLFAIFLPSFLLVFGVMPFWDRLRANARVQAALAGVNAAVVGLLLAALYDPVWTSAVSRPVDLALVLLALAALMVWKLPPWLVVLAGSLAGWVFAVAA